MEAAREWKVAVLEAEGFDKERYLLRGGVVRERAKGRFRADSGFGGKLLAIVIEHSLLTR